MRPRTTVRERACHPSNQAGDELPLCLRFARGHIVVDPRLQLLIFAASISKIVIGKNERDALALFVKTDEHLAGVSEAVQCQIGFAGIFDGLPVMGVEFERLAIGRERVIVPPEFPVGEAKPGPSIVMPRAATFCMAVITPSQFFASQASMPSA